MRYFITGGAGFIGSNYVDLLLREASHLDIQVTVFDKLTYAGNLRNLSAWQDDPRLRIVVGDICDKTAIESAMVNQDYVIHFAAESHVDRSIHSAGPFVQTNVLGTLNVLEAARLRNVKTFIHVSTDEVYGSLDEGSAKENYPLLPNSPYAASKAASDLLVRSFSKTYGLDIRITRCSNNYGKHQYPEKLIPVIINSILAKREIPIYGNGLNVREWIHVEDHAHAIDDVLRYGLPGEIYNIGSNKYLTNLELVNQICAIMGRGNELVTFVADRAGHDYRYSINCEKFEKIKSRETKDFNQGLTETISWYVENSNWWSN